MKFSNKFFDKYSGLKRTPNYLLAMVAILVALCMWYYVRVGEQMETQLDVDLDYAGIPANLVVTSGLVSKITVRLRGPAVLIRSIPQGMRNQIINLSTIKKGKTTVPIGGEDMGAVNRAFEVIDIQPPSLTVSADTLVERSVPVHTVFDYPLGDDAIPVENLTVKPPAVTIRGPEALIKDIHHVTLPIHIDPNAQDRTVDETMVLNTPGLVTSNPSSVRVGYRITSGREVIPHISPITLSGSKSKDYTTEPTELPLLVEVPKRLIKDENYLNKIRLYATIPALEPGQSKAMPIRAELPDGITLTRPITEEVIVSRIK